MSKWFYWLKEGNKSKITLWSTYALKKPIFQRQILIFVLGLSVGDFNADGMDDLYCHTDDGNTNVARSTVKGSAYDFTNARNIFAVINTNLDKLINRTVYCNPHGSSENKADKYVKSLRLSWSEIWNHRL